MWENIFRKELKELKPYIPGKSIQDVKKEIGIDFIEKLASNENPFGPSPKAVEAIKKELQNIHIYPDPTARELREKISGHFDLSSENIIIGSGGEYLLQLIAQTFINEGDEAIMADTTFSLYETSVSLMGGIAVKVLLNNFKHDFDGFINNISSKTKLLYICNPNNPTGNIMTSEEVNSLIKRVPDNIAVVFDEAYYDYACGNEEYPDTIKILKERENTIILRTFSKISGLAALRVGYLITSKEIATQINKIRSVFNVNSLAQAAALAALDDKKHIDMTIAANNNSLEKMKRYFKSKGFEFVDSYANFIFVNVKNDSRMVFQKLMEKGVIIRPGYLWGYDNWLRVSTGTDNQTEKFITSLDQIVSVYNMKN